MLALRDVEKVFGEERVLRAVSLEIPAGQIMALVGPSGSGKTTLLRIIAGLESADGGRLFLDGHDLAEMPVHERGFGMVFQDYALFPHKSVAENVAFGLRMLRWERQRIRARVSEMLALVGMAGFGERPIHELSGGEQQRVALARALAPSPRLLLLDEPLGALDRALRERLMGELRSILKAAGEMSDRERGITSIYVTHDQAEAFAVADRVAVIRRGALEQIDAPVELYRRPRTPFVARFIGMENLFTAEIAGRQPPEARTPLGELRVASAGLPAEIGEGAIVLIRPDAGRVLASEEEGVNVVTGRLESVSFRGRYQEVTVRVGDDVVLELEFDPGQEMPAVGESVRLSLDPAGVVLMDSAPSDL